MARHTGDLGVSEASVCVLEPLFRESRNIARFKVRHYFKKRRRTCISPAPAPEPAPRPILLAPRAERRAGRGWSDPGWLPFPNTCPPWACSWPCGGQNGPCRGGKARGEEEGRMAVYARGILVVRRLFLTEQKTDRRRGRSWSGALFRCSSWLFGGGPREAEGKARAGDSGQRRTTFARCCAVWAWGVGAALIVVSVECKMQVHPAH